MEENRKNTCMYCFADTGGATKCPNCGGDASAEVPQDHLIPGTILGENWLVGRAVGQDATGIVYVAMDINKRAKARIREYFPRDCAQRMPDGSIQIVPGEDERYNEGLVSLRESVQSPDDPEKAHPFFEANNTLYVVQLRKKKTPAAAAHEEDAEPDMLKKQILLFVGVIAVLVIGVLIAVSMIGRNAADKVTGDTLLTVPPLVNTLEPSEAPSEPTLAPDATVTPDPFGNLPTSIPLDWQGVAGTGNNTQDDYYGAYEDVTDIATPTPAPTVASSSVNPDSSPADIKALQWRLIELGWLDAQTADGVYGTDTRYAVAHFQKLIRDSYGADVKANGYADATTLKWLNASNAPVNPDRTAQPTLSPSPSVQPTSAPATQPPITAITAITPDSPAADILAMQNRLVTLGWLEADYATGAYNTQTRYAVAYFQKALKEQGIDVSATGYADTLTLTWLYEAGAPRPTAAPSSTPAAQYSYRIDQYYFTAVDGVLSSGYDKKIEGSVQTTDKASLSIEAPASNFEGYVFDAKNENNRLSMTFESTDDVYAFRVIYVRNTASATAAPTEAPTQTPTQAPTETPTEEPTQAPTEAPTEAPTQAPAETGVIDESSSPERILSLQNRLVELGWLEDPTDADGSYNIATVNAVTAFQDKLTSLYGAELFDSVEDYIPGYADIVTQQYLFAADAPAPDPAPVPTQEAAPEPTQVPAPAAKQYSYQINQFYFTAVDGVMNSASDYKETSGVLTTQETSLTISVPESVHEGYAFDASSEYNILSQNFSDEGTVYTYQVVYIRQTASPTPEPTPEPIPEPTPEPTPVPVVEYTYRVDQYYFTETDGVLSGSYDYRVEGDVQTTTAGSLTVEAPASAYEGYLFDAGSEHNRLSMTFDDPATGYVFQVIYVRTVVTPDPTPEPTPEPTPAPAAEYSYRVDQYYFTAVDGVLNSGYDHSVEGDVQTTTAGSLTIEAPASAYEGYVFDAGSEHNRLSMTFESTDEVYTFRVIYVQYTSAPEPEITPEPVITPEPEPEPEPTPEPEPEAPSAPEQAVTDEQVNALPDMYQQAYPDQGQKTPQEIVSWIQKVFVKYDQTFATSYYPAGYTPTGVYDAETKAAVRQLQEGNSDLMAVLDPNDLGVVTDETFQLIANLYEELKNA